MAGAACLLAVFFILPKSALASSMRVGQSQVVSTPTPVPAAVGTSDAQTGGATGGAGGSSFALQQTGCEQSGDCTIEDIVQMGVNFAQFIMGLSGALFLLVFIYGGARYVLSFGKQDWVSKGRDAMVHAAIGIVIIMSAWTIVSYVAQSLGYIGSSTGGSSSVSQNNTGSSGGTGRCICNGNVAAGNLLPDATFDSYCDQAKHYCASCGGGKAMSCHVEVDISEEDCLAMNTDKAAMLEKYGIPSIALTLLNISGSCVYTKLVK